MFAAQCVFITGGAVGIGRGLAAELRTRGAKVILGGRRAEVLRAAAAELGADYVVLDVADAASVAQAAESIAARHGDLDCLINNAGVQRRVNFAAAQQPAPDALREEIDINFVGLVQTTSAFLPHLQRQSAASVINVSSGLAFVPLAHVPLYCATKAAVHSFSQSLRRQLRPTSVRVIEVAPPLVYDTDLHEGQPPMSEEMKARGMSVADFTRATFAALDAGEDEIVVGAAGRLHAQLREPLGQAFAMMNGA